MISRMKLTCPTLEENGPFRSVLLISELDKVLSLELIIVPNVPRIKTISRTIIHVHEAEQLLSMSILLPTCNNLSKQKTDPSATLKESPIRPRTVVYLPPKP